MAALLVGVATISALNPSALARARAPMATRVFDRIFSGALGAATPLPTNFRALADGADGQSAPSWDALRAKVLQTPTGQRLAAEDLAREQGEGPPHRAAKLRLFGQDITNVRLTFYRDSAGALARP
jgi:hypothetical protein